jgi:hypothetical protein
VPRAVSDAGPLHYLVLIGAIDILPRMIDFAAALLALRATNFRARPELFDPLLARHRKQHGA